ncbi:putative CheY-like receiver [Candidatus Terasakiella magnetica]|nr:putative CheY-like receiver [Candidatus Terasakiella magnetica]
MKAKKAVIVEDSIETRLLIKLVLDSLGIRQVVEAQNGVAAITALKADPAHIAIMDWKMDVMDGLECTRRIRAGIDGINPQLPIILLTGNHGQAPEAAAYTVGVDLFMEKPVSMKSLYAAVSKVLQGASPDKTK